MRQGTVSPSGTEYFTVQNNGSYHIQNLHIPLLNKEVC